MVTNDYIKKGKLVYIPSGVRLFVRDRAEDGFYVERYVDTDKPTNCIVMSDEIKNNLCEILYCGKLWYVKMSDAYVVREQKQKENKHASNSC